MPLDPVIGQTNNPPSGGGPGGKVTSVHGATGITATPVTGNVTVKLVKVKASALEAGTDIDITTVGGKAKISAVVTPTVESVAGTAPIKATPTTGHVDVSWDPTTTVTFNTQKIINLAAGIAAGEAVNYTQLVAHGLPKHTITGIAFAYIESPTSPDTLFAVGQTTSTSIYWQGTVTKATPTTWTFKTGLLTYSFTPEIIQIYYFDKVSHGQIINHPTDGGVIILTLAGTSLRIRPTGIWVGNPTSSDSYKLPIHTTPGTTGQVITKGSGKTSSWKTPTSGGGTVTSVMSPTGTITVATDTTTPKLKIEKVSPAAVVNGTHVTKSTTGGKVKLSVPTATNAKQFQSRAVHSTAPTATQVYAWTATNDYWRPITVTRHPNGSAGGDLSGTYPNPTISKVPSSSLIEGTHVNISTTGGKAKVSATTHPTGNATGDLSGTYPNPSVVKLRGRSIHTTAPTATQVYAWTSTNSYWKPKSLTAGTVTTVSSPTGEVGISTPTTTPKLSVAKVPFSAVVAGTRVTLSTTGGKLKITASVQTTSKVAMGGDVTGTSTASSVVKLRGRNIHTTAPTATQVYAWTATNSYWKPKSVGTGTVTTVSSPTGTITVTTGATTPKLKLRQGTTPSSPVQLPAVTCVQFGAILPRSPTYTNTAGTLTAATTGTLTVDSHTVALNDTVAVCSQTTAFENGFYKCTTAGGASAKYVLTRLATVNTSAKLGRCLAAHVTSGNIYSKGMVLFIPTAFGATFTIGTTSTFGHPAVATNLSGGTGIACSTGDTVFRLRLTGTTLFIVVGTKHIIVSTSGIMTVPSGGSFSTALAAVFSTHTIVSGTAWTPSSTKEAMVYFTVTLAGTLTLTVNTHKLATAIAVVAGSFFSFRVPAGQAVKVTLTTATVTHAFQYTC